MQRWRLKVTIFVYKTIFKSKEERWWTRLHRGCAYACSKTWRHLRFLYFWLYLRFTLHIILLTHCTLRWNLTKTESGFILCTSTEDITRISPHSVMRWIVVPTSLLLYPTLILPLAVKPYYHNFDLTGFHSQQNLLVLTATALYKAVKPRLHRVVSQENTDIQEVENGVTKAVWNDFTENHRQTRDWEWWNRSQLEWFHRNTLIYKEVKTVKPRVISQEIAV